MTMYDDEQCHANGYVVTHRYWRMENLRRHHH